MPIKIARDLRKKIETVASTLQKHLDEGVEIKLSIARIQDDQKWLKIVGLIILTAIAGLYLKG
jgi:hypothetical protein